MKKAIEHLESEKKKREELAEFAEESGDYILYIDILTNINSIDYAIELLKSVK